MMTTGWTVLWPTSRSCASISGTNVGPSSDSFGADPDRAEALARRDAEQPLAINFACNGAKLTMGDQKGAACQRATLPVLVVHGSEDPRPLDGVYSLVEALPDAQLEVIPGTGHNPWIERPEALTHLIRDFLRRTALEKTA